MRGTTEAFARVKIDKLLEDAGWNLTDGVSVPFEHALPDGTQSDYALCDRRGYPPGTIGLRKLPQSRQIRRLWREIADIRTWGAERHRDHLRGQRTLCAPTDQQW